jgi:hypothetical protein
MSRLDSFIRRLEAQRQCLEFGVGLISGEPGPVFELGLGNGRTYDHLRAICPDREIFVFERKVAAHPDCIPDPAHLFEGPIEETLPKVARRFGGKVALVHADLGSGRPDLDRRTSAFLSIQVPVFLKPGGVVLSDQPLEFPHGRQVSPPGRIAEDRYHIYRLEPTGGA